jgi:hypothetical protein
VDAGRIADDFAARWHGAWVVTLGNRTVLHLRVVDGTRTISVAAHPSMLSTYIEHVGAWCEAPATCRLAARTDRESTGVRWLTLMSRCPVCLPKLLERVVQHELAALPDGAPRDLAMRPVADTRGRATRIGGSTVMAASATARHRLSGHVPARPVRPLPTTPPRRAR